ncbi:MAG: T9SS type A sorting domain-containing protein, partial [Ignavibacteriaceae bacterium]|nr:T9SS type A sorting domain-containing protein [Ignavibacteriaceae bacterium]
WSDGATATLYPAVDSTVTGVVWTSGTAHGNTNLMVARAKYGSGRVVLVCDSSPADDGTGAAGNTLYVGWLDPSVNGSHAALHMNGSLWLAKVIEPVTLPVELTSFTASSSTNNVTLIWNTATELNNSGFSIERSTLNNNFLQIGFVSGKGTTAKSSSYSFTDKNLASGNYIYRLKQIDFDGHVNYSNNVNVDVALMPNFSLDQNYPNPFNPSTSISFTTASNSLVTLKIYNTLGQLIKTLVNEIKPSGTYKVNFNASDIPSGVYIYKLTSNSQILTNKMILIK